MQICAIARVHWSTVPVRPGALEAVDRMRRTSSLSLSENAANSRRNMMRFSLIGFRKLDRIAQGLD